MNATDNNGASSVQTRPTFALTAESVLPITGDEFALIRELLQRSRDEHLSRVRDNNLGLSALDGVVARAARAAETRA